MNANLDAMTQDMMDSAGITVEYHTHDGFTLWAMDREGYLTHRRFVGYTVREGKRLFREELRG